MTEPQGEAEEQMNIAGEHIPKEECSQNEDDSRLDLEEILNFVNAVPAFRVAAAASIAWYRAMGLQPLGQRTRQAEMYVVACCASRIADENLFDRLYC